jgi:hypothetical protein
MINKFLFLLLVLLSQQAFAAEIPNQNDHADRIDPLDQSFMTLQMASATSGFSLALINSQGNRTINYSPNLLSSTSLSVAFKDYIGASFSFRSAAEPQTQYSKGTTDYDDFHFTFDFSSFYFETIYERYNGLYILNSSDADPSVRGNILLPNMSVQNIVFNYTYIFQPKNFSISAALSRTERQIKSGGSWLMGASYIQTTLANASGLLPPAVRNQYGPDQNITDDRTRSLIVTGGYGHTFVFAEKYFTTLLGNMGLGAGESSFSDTVQSFHAGYTAFKIALKVIFAYNGDSFIGGADVQADSLTSQTNSMQIQSGPVFVTLFVGTRF